MADEWKQRPEAPDNHWLDCLVGAIVAAAMQGAAMVGAELARKRKRPRITAQDLPEHWRRRAS